MKVFSFPTCKGLLKIAATNRFEALRTFKQLVKRRKRDNALLPLIKIKSKFTLITSSI